MTDIMTDEDFIREALKRLNPTAYKCDYSWYALNNIMDELEELRTKKDKPT